MTTTNQPIKQASKHRVCPARARFAKANACPMGSQAPGPSPSQDNGLRTTSKRAVCHAHACTPPDAQSQTQTRGHKHCKKQTIRKAKNPRNKWPGGMCGAPEYNEKQCFCFSHPEPLSASACVRNALGPPPACFWHASGLLPGCL